MQGVDIGSVSRLGCLLADSSAWDVVCRPHVKDRESLIRTWPGLARLQRVKTRQNDETPHAKSFTMQRLGGFVRRASITIVASIPKEGSVTAAAVERLPESLRLSGCLTERIQLKR